MYDEALDAVEDQRERTADAARLVRGYRIWLGVTCAFELLCLAATGAIAVTVAEADRGFLAIPIVAFVLGTFVIATIYNESIPRSRAELLKAKKKLRERERAANRALAVENETNHRIWVETEKNS